MTIQLQDSTFDELVLGSERPVLVDFWAEWCGPCKALAPVLDELAATGGDNFEIAKLDIDANPLSTTRFDVMSIPTLILFSEGQPVLRLVGARSREQLSSELSRVLAVS